MLNPHWRLRFRAIALLLLGGWLAFNLFQTAGRILSFYTPLPIWDYWREVANLPAFQTSQWGVLWQQHNEHRIVFPEIVYAADLLMAQGRMLLPLIASSLAYVTTWCLLCLPVWQDANISAAQRALAVLFSGIIAFCETASVALAVPFLLQWTLMQGGVALALLSLSRARRGASALYLALLIIGGTVASFSSLAGLAVWPVLMAGALLLRWPARGLTPLLLATLANYLLFFAGYRLPSSTSGLVALAAHPIYTLQFLACYLSAPFGLVKSPVFAITVGCCNLALAAGLFVANWRRNPALSGPFPVLSGYYTFSLLVALLTAAGRMNPGDIGFLAPRQPRYLSVPQMNWAALILLFFWTAARSPHSRKILPAGAAILTLACLPAFVKLHRWLGVESQFFRNQQQATRSIEQGRLDPALITHYVYPDYQTVVVGLARLRSSRLSIYAPRR